MNTEEITDVINRLPPPMQESARQAFRNIDLRASRAYLRRAILSFVLATGTAYVAVDSAVHPEPESRFAPLAMTGLTLMMLYTGTNNLRNRNKTLKEYNAI